jgi:hypothetical protein
VRKLTLAGKAGMCRRRDFHATVLHLLGFDHQRFSVRHRGLDQRLTGAEPAHLIPELLA